MNNSNMIGNIIFLMALLGCYYTIKKIIRFFFPRTPCCNAKYVEERGWGRRYCEECGERYKTSL